MNPELRMFPPSLIGGRPRPRRPFTDPFSSHVSSWGGIPEADSEAVPMPPLRRLRSCFFDDGPHSEIREGDLANMRRKYAIHPSVGMRSPTEFKRAPDGGAGEVVVYEAYLEAGFRGVIPSLIGEVSSFFGFCPSQLTPLTWRTLMAIQILGKLHGFSFGVHEILYSYYFAPLMNKAGRYVFVKIQEPVGYPTSWRTDVSHLVSFAGEAVAKLIMGVPRRFRWVNFLLFPRNVARLPLSVVYDEYQKDKARKQRPSYTPPPRLVRAALSANGPSSTSSTSVEVGHDRDPLVDAHRRLIGEVFLLCVQLQDMVARRDLLVQQVKASARWELMKEWLEKSVEHSNPEEAYRRHYFLPGGVSHQSGASPRLPPRDLLWEDVLPPVLRSKWNFVVYDASLFIGYVRTRGSSGDTEVVEEPGGGIGTRRFFDRSGDHGWNPEDDFWQVVKEEKLQEGDFEVESLMSFGGSHWCRSKQNLEHQSTYTSPNRSTGTPEHRSTPTESTASCNAVKILTHEEFAAKHPQPPNPVNVRIDRHANNNIDLHSEAAIDRQPPMPIDQRAPITYRVQMPKIDVARLNALRPKPKPSEYPPETVRTPSDVGEDPMEEDRVPSGRTLRKRKEKVLKHLKREASEKEKENFRKRVFRIPPNKPFEEAYYTHRLWLFFTETREKEEDIKRMFCEAREKMRMRITLKKKSEPGQFAIPCTVKGIEFPHALCDTGASVSILPRVIADHLGLQVEPS
ncbi:hypothetical protein F2Q70_00002739 [Brassica cretica]|uniref:Uncharacterized protein n=1 Tax=Brassica cretica TaxID=69181 RepID=A0A8S9IKQ3_BRACR|nr:hypothetical protein F2Q70_00002739 [Brassica cretica]